MREGVGGEAGEVPSRHPLAALPFGAILTFVGVRRRRGPRDAGRDATTATQQAPAVADRRGLYALLTAEGVSQVGNAMTIVAGPWFVLETTGSAARTGIVSGALAVGGVVSAVLGGPLVDRLGFKRTSVLADLASAATVAAVPLLHRAGILQFWQLVLLVFVFASLNSNGDTARFGLVPFLADRAQMPTERANGADRGIIRLGTVLGPVLGGVLIAALGAVNVLLVGRRHLHDLGHPGRRRVPGAANRAAQPEIAGGRSYLAELGEGLRVIRAHTVLLWMILIATVGNFLDKPLITVILPVYVKTIYGSPTSLGLALGAFGAGALTGSLAFGTVGRGWPRRLTFLSCWVLGPLVIFGTLAATPPLWVVVPAGLVGGLLFGPINPIASTVIQEHTPPAMLGRVFGALTALAQAGIPIGAVLAGVVVQRAGLVPTIVGMGAIYLLVPLSMFFNDHSTRWTPGGVGKRPVRLRRSSNAAHRPCRLLHASVRVGCMTNDRRQRATGDVGCQVCSSSARTPTAGERANAVGLRTSPMPRTRGGCQVEIRRLRGSSSCGAGPPDGAGELGDGGLDELGDGGLDELGDGGLDQRPQQPVSPMAASITTVGLPSPWQARCRR